MTPLKRPRVGTKFVDLEAVPGQRGELLGVVFEVTCPCSDAPGAWLVLYHDDTGDLMGCTAIEHRDGQWRRYVEAELR